MISASFRYAGTPLADHVPADWSDKVMHGSLTLGDQVLMGGDVAPDQSDHWLTSAWSRRADRPVPSCWNGARL